MAEMKYPNATLMNGATNGQTGLEALLRVWRSELWAGSYYRKRPLAAAQLLYARWRLSRANPQPPDPRTFLSDLGIDPHNALVNLERWRDTLLGVVALSQQEDESIGIAAAEGVALYGLVRALRPEYVVETGVATGVSTSFICAALIENGFGNLYSIDLPPGESAGVIHTDGSRSVLRGPGWAVPKTIRVAMQARHEILLEDVRTALPKLLTRLPRVDFFLHDDLHTPGHMYWEYDLVWPRLSVGGALVSDDIHYSWLQFCRSIGVGKHGHRNLQRLGVILKTKAPLRRSDDIGPR
jgi:Methyltransferase domain